MLIFLKGSTDSVQINLPFISGLTRKKCEYQAERVQVYIYYLKRKYCLGKLQS